MNLSTEQNRSIAANEAPRKRTLRHHFPDPSHRPGSRPHNHRGQLLSEIPVVDSLLQRMGGNPKIGRPMESSRRPFLVLRLDVIVLELATLILLYTAISLRQMTFSSFLRTALRLAASLTLTVLGTGVLALVWSWVKQSH